MAMAAASTATAQITKSVIPYATSQGPVSVIGVGEFEILFIALAAGWYEPNGKVVFSGNGNAVHRFGLVPRALRRLQRRIIEKKVTTGLFETGAIYRSVGMDENANNHFDSVVAGRKVVGGSGSYSDARLFINKGDRLIAVRAGRWRWFGAQQPENERERDYHAKITALSNRSAVERLSYARLILFALQAFLH